MTAETVAPGRRLRPFDAFMLANVVALAALVGVAALLRSREFALYALVFLAVGGALWPLLRPYRFPWWLLAMFEAGVVAHFMGGLVHLGAGNLRLYDAHVLGITFDKYVHAYNAAVGTLVFRRLFDQTSVRLGPRSGPLFAASVALSAGVAVEMVEYFAYVLIPHTGVGGYANNMQDLYANWFGASVAVAAMWPWRRVAQVSESSGTPSDTDTSASDPVGVA